MQPDRFHSRVRARRVPRRREARHRRHRIELWAADGVPLPQAPPELPPGRQRFVLCALSPDVHVWGDRPDAAMKRMKRDSETLSRAALKLDEALEWVGDGPGAKETCVDSSAPLPAGGLSACSPVAPASSPSTPRS